MTEADVDATAAAEHFLAAARDSGLAHVAISPGSRSTPLAVAAMRTVGLTTSLHIDERVASFHAVGRAAHGEPVALICTSGTAAANYLPAIAEASMNNLPVLAITADRPPEHQSWGVGQTFVQRGLYHGQVRAEFHMPVGADGGLEFCARAGWRSTCTAITSHGPVHVNWPFRLPLEPAFAPQEPPQRFHRPTITSETTPSEAERLSQLLSSAERPVMIAGPGAMRSPGYGAAIDNERCAQLHSWAGASKIPIIADALSGLRSPTGSTNVEAGALLPYRSQAVLGRLAPDLIIRLGHTPTAKSIRLWWERLDCQHILLDPFCDWQDPSHRATERFTSDPVALLSASELPNLDSSWADDWMTAGLETREIATSILDSSTALTDAHVATQVGQSLGSGDLLFASSSLPVRDIDSFVGVNIAFGIFANRGINGIDGVASSASGFKSASGLATTLLIGDVALLHDVGGVLDCARNETPLVIVVPNNDGGGIFSLLPARSALDTESFSRLFDTPHGSTFEFLSGYQNIAHKHVTDVCAALEEAHRYPSAAVTILEVSTDTGQRLELQQKLHDRLGNS